MNDFILTPSESLDSISKPKLLRFAEVSSIGCTALLLAAGFEERSLGVLKALAKRDEKFAVFMVRYLPLVPENRAEEIVSFCNENRIDVIELEYDRRDPRNFGEILLEAVPKDARILVDVSTMSRLLIVQVVVALANSDFSRDFTIGYCEAESYSPSREKADAILDDVGKSPSSGMTFLSSGVLQVAIVPELSSATYGSQQTRLIVFPSFDSHHFIAVRSEILPSRFSFIEGIPPETTNLWRTATIRKINELEKFPVSDCFAVSTLDYRETLDLLLEIYHDHSLRERIIISPTGSKMQTVAVGVFKAYLDDVQIVYPVAKNFTSPESYSSGIGEKHLLNVNQFFKREC